MAYADAVKSHSAPIPKVTPTNDFLNTNTSFNFIRFEDTIDKLVQTINNFTANMINLLKEMLRMQNTLLQAIVNKP